MKNKKKSFSVPYSLTWNILSPLGREYFQWHSTRNRWNLKKAYIIGSTMVKGTLHSEWPRGRKKKKENFAESLNVRAEIESEIRGQSNSFRRSALQTNFIFSFGSSSPGASGMVIRGVQENWPDKWADLRAKLIPRSNRATYSVSIRPDREFFVVCRWQPITPRQLMVIHWPKRVVVV